MMFDAIKFDVAMVTKEGFERLDKSIYYTYAWKYEDEPADDIEQKEKSDDFLEAMVSQVMAAGNEVEDYTPRYSNPAINFATDDMGSDKYHGRSAFRHSYRDNRIHFCSDHKQYDSK